tara:strand:- start:5097 stop:5243 length:147 start_codon:yes stop_codon:yes gene_type:complete
MNNCSICDSELEEDDCKGFLGQTEFGLCIWCYSSLQMMYSNNNKEDAN